MKVGYDAGPLCSASLLSVASIFCGGVSDPPGLIMRWYNIQYHEYSEKVRSMWNSKCKQAFACEVAQLDPPACVHLLPPAGGSLCSHGRRDSTSPVRF